MLDFNWDDTGDLGVYVRTSDGRQVCVEAMLCDAKGNTEGVYVLATSANPRWNETVIVGDSNILPGVKAGTKLRGDEALAYVEKLRELQRTCPQIAVNDQQERLRDSDAKAGRGSRWELPPTEEAT